MLNFFRGEPEVAVKGQKNQTENIERGQNRRRDSENPNKISMPGECPGQNSVFGKEPREERNAGDGHRPD